ncbi:amino acid adenylation domain-containing protein [Sorangium sp. So ce216]
MKNRGPDTPEWDKRQALLKKLLEQRGLDTSKWQAAPVPRRGSPVTLSFGQERMWFLEQLHPRSARYTIAVAKRMEGRLDVPALSRSIDEIVRRHDVLRLGVGAGPDGPAPFTLDAISLDVPVVDLRSLAGGARWSKLEELCAREAETPLVLSEPPLLRFCLARLDDDDHVLLLTVHHIIFDGWSLGLFFDELWPLYTAFADGLPSPLPPLTLQYNDYAVWQRARVAGGQLAEQHRYWTARLAGAPALLALPWCRPRPAQLGTRGGVVRFDVDPGTRRRLGAAAERAGATMYMVLLAAFGVFLARYSGMRDIVVGSPIANRQSEQLEPLLGLFVNTLALRLDLAGNPPFSTLLEQAREVALGAYNHQELPFEKVVEELHPARSLSYTPVFQAFFVLQNTPKSADAVDGLRISDLGMPSASAKFDLTLSMSEGGGGLNAHFEYNTALFDASAVQRMADNFTALLAGIAEDPEQRIENVPIVGDAERALIRAQWQSRPAARSARPCVHEIFAAGARRWGEATAIIEGDRRMTYSELARASAALAEVLLGHGVAPEVRVAVLMPRCSEAILAMLAVLQAGGAYVPLDPEHPPARIAHLLAGTRPLVVLTSRHLEPRLSGVDSVVLCVDGAWDTGRPASRPMPIVSPSSLAYIRHTSGSTGRPKGVCVEHAALSAYVESALEALDLEPGMSFALVQPLTADACLTTLWGCLCSGGALHVIAGVVALDPKLMSAYVRDRSIDYLKLTPSHLQALLASGERVMPRRRLVLGGEPPSWSWFRGLASSAPECRIYNQYGPTEATVGVLMYRLEPEDVALAFSVAPLGRRLADAEIHVLDDHMQPVPIGVPGEVYVGGPSLARGYWESEELTRQRFVPHPQNPLERLYKTGDIGRLHPGGHLEYVGRADTQIKVRGFRVEPEEVRAALTRHPQVRDAVVVCRGSEPATQRLLAYYIPGASLPSPDRLRDHLLANVPAYMVPSSFIAVTEFPMRAHGKIDVDALPDPSPMPPNAAANDAPRDGIEATLVRIWEELLPCGPIGIRQDFFELGGHSLLAIQMMSRVKRELDETLPVSLLFERPTVERLAAALRSSTTPLHRSCVEMRAGSRDAPLFLIPGTDGNVLCFIELVRHLGGEHAVYGLQAMDIDGSPALPSSVDALAARHVSEITGAQPHGPYFLGGYSFGGKVALQIALQLQRRGERVAFLCVVDGLPPEGGAQPAGVWDGSITLLRTATGPEAAGWAAHCTSPVRVHVVEGAHRDMLRAPHVQTLAALVSACLAPLMPLSKAGTSDDERS